MSYTMTDKDLSIIRKKPRKVQLNGTEVPLRILTLEEHFNREFDAQEIDQFNVTNRKDIKKLAGMIKAYVKSVLNITPEETENISIEEYKKLRKYMDRIDLYDQGFDDREIDGLEKKRLTLAMGKIVDKELEDI